MVATSALESRTHEAPRADWRRWLRTALAQPSGFVSWPPEGGSPRLAAWGATAEVDAAGANRWEALRAGCSHFHKQLRDGAGAASARLLVTGTFEPDRVDRGGLWSCAAARAWMPAVLMTDATTPTLTLSRRVGGPGDRVQPTLDDLERATQKALEVPGAGSLGPLPHAPELEQRDFERAVQTVVDAIARGRVAKVVLARSETRRVAMTVTDCVQALELLRELAPRAVVYAQRVGDRIFLGATPERVATLRGRTLETHALAGTRRAAAPTRVDAKLAREHGLVVQDLERRLAPLVTEVRAGARGTQRYGDVEHLETPLEATLAPSADLLAVLTAIHPSPALAGEPRESALTFIRELEPVARGLYGGVFGSWAPSGDAEIHIALRCALVGADGARCMAGAGIVDGSVPTDEWQETNAKLALVHRALGLGAP